MHERLPDCGLARQRSVIGDGLAVAAGIVVYGLVFRLLFWFAGLFDTPEAVSVWYPPAGWRFAILLVFGWRLGFVVFAAEAAVAVMSGMDGRWPLHDPGAMTPEGFVSYVVAAAIPPFCYTVAAAYLRPLLRPTPANTTMRRVLLFVGVATLASLAAAAFGSINLAAAEVIAWSAVPTALTAHWRGDLVGVLTLTPGLIVLAGAVKARLTSTTLPGFDAARILSDFHSDTPARPARAGGEVTLVLLLSALFFASTDPRTLPSFAFVLPSLWLALRFGILGAVFAAFAANLAIAVLVLAAAPAANGTDAQLLMIMVSIVSLMLGGVTSDLAEERACLDRRIAEQTRELCAEVERRRAAEQAAVREQRRAERFLASARTVIVVIDDTGTVILANDEAADLVGYHREDLRGLNWLDEAVPAEERCRAATALRAALDGAVSGVTPYKGAVKVRNGDRRTVEWRMTLFRDDPGAAPSVLMAGVDVTEREIQDRHVRFLATHDPLTGLRNRNSLMVLFPDAVARAQRHGTLLVALFLDLDDFKAVNDRHGHTAGDLVLVETARRLRDCLRESDTVARLGGDEFLVLLEGATDPAHGARVAEKILGALRAPIDLGSSVVTVDASIGIAALPTDAETADELMAAADAAMYLAKQSPQSAYRIAGVRLPAPSCAD